LPSDSLESGFNPHTSSHGLAGAELTRLPLNAPTSNQESNCNVRPGLNYYFLVVWPHQNGLATEEIRQRTGKSFDPLSFVPQIG
jgi:hypothetical protein